MAYRIAWILDGALVQEVLEDDSAIFSLALRKSVTEEFLRKLEVWKLI